MPINPNFDIDICIKEGDLLTAMGVVQDGDFKVDVVDFDAVPMHLRKRIVDSGKCS